MTHTFEDSSFHLDLELGAGCKVTAHVTVASAAVERFYKQAVKAVSKYISIPGFRKGKAPDAVIVSRYRANVEEEWKTLVIQEGVQGAFDLCKIYPYHKELLEKPRLLSCEREQKATFTFAYERYPELPDIDFAQLKLTPIEKEAITETQIDEIVQGVRRAHAEYETVADKTIALGDYAEISVHNRETNAALVERRRICVEGETIVPWLHDLLLGMKADESKETEIPEGKIPVRVAVHAVQRAILPEVGDELAKKAWADSWEDLLTKVRHNLERDAEETQRYKQYQHLEEVLLAAYPFEVPTSMHRAELRARLKGASEQSENMEQQADKSLRLFFLKRQIAKQGKISLSKEELNLGLLKHLQNNPAAFHKDPTPEESETVISQVSASLLDRKIQDYALSAALTN